MTNEIVQYSVSDMERLASAIAKSKLFGMKTPEEALALMAISQAEGLHPAIAARDYHIINGRPTLKADAMLARFQSAGGKVEWHSYTDECCEATLSHPQGGSVKVMWDMERVKQAEIKNSSMYNKYPRNMLRARVISEGIRTVYPGVVIGTYTPEEEQEFEPQKSPMKTWAESAPSLPPVIENEPTVGLNERAEAFMAHLRKMPNQLSFNNLMANNNKLLLALHSDLPEIYEKISQEILQHQDAYRLAEAAE